jgi:hypothetical protein
VIWIVPKQLIRFSSLFSFSREQLLKLAGQALEDERAGRTVPLDPDRL